MEKNFNDLRKEYIKFIAQQNQEIENLRKANDLFIDSISESTFVKKMEHAFNESRLTHPILGFKHKDFKEYWDWFTKYPPSL